MGTIRRQKEVHRQIRMLWDAALFCLAFWMAHLLRSHWPIEVFGGTAAIEPFDQYSWLLLVIFPLGPLLLYWQGYYHQPVLCSRKVIAWQLLRGCLLVPVFVILAMFVARNVLSRSVIILFGPISFALLLTKELVMRYWMLSQWGQSQFKRVFILVGTKEDNARFKADYRKYSSEGVEIRAQLNLDDSHHIDRLADLLHEHSANGIILTAQHTYFGQIEKAVQICELEGVEAWLLADFFKTQISKTVLDDFMDRPVLVFRSTPDESWQAVAKLVIDRVGALASLIIFSPLFLAIALLIKRTSPGPIFFRQQRSGLNGKPFTMLKFRSMSTDAEQRKHELEALNEMSGPVFKLTDDPRITPIGKILRRYSLDELPQLWNVLKGEMSLVGPRPLPVDEVKRFDQLSHRRRLSVKPGLTCLWQISGRNNVTDFKDWVKLDLEYIDNWSIWLDIKILLRTIPVVFMGTGAK